MQGSSTQFESRGNTSKKKHVLLSSSLNLDLKSVERKRRIIDCGLDIIIRVTAELK